MTDLWDYENDLKDVARNVVGFEVVARDGSIGHIDSATSDIGSSFLVVDTGPWIFGKKVLLPAGLIEAIDVDNELVYVERDRSDIESAPEFRPDTYAEESYRQDIATYYEAGPLLF